MTVFLYLNDVEEGGGTRFTELDITVQPKRGRALLWPSVLDQWPNHEDPSTNHEALPVIKGVKYGANAVSVCRGLFGANMTCTHIHFVARQHFDGSQQSYQPDQSH